MCVGEEKGKAEGELGMGLSLVPEERDWGGAGKEAPEELRAGCNTQ